MASIFTWEEAPPRVASPWNSGIVSSDSPFPKPGPNRGSSPASVEGQGGHHRSVWRLPSEPQEGPVEYKLHLLLRPRRSFTATSTSKHISGSKHTKIVGKPATRTTSDSLLESRPTSGSATPPAASTALARQHRLESLTTQLLWRLQQSSPHHSSASTNTTLPSLPEPLPELETPLRPAKLVRGLEESQGALYEIGVADDGTLIGLAEDEMKESLNNLRAMAACLGCEVDVLREEIVGNCEWLEDKSTSGRQRSLPHSGPLVVTEALVKPILQQLSPTLPGGEQSHVDNGPVLQSLPTIHTTATEQLRVTLTGPTMSGKSTLLGTLTTSTMDDGRGKSRVSMFRHRHEINSGVTSSVTQELLGYVDGEDGEVDVVNLASNNIASWIDIHAAAAGGRLVLISDSAGHPRYRRTAVKGLVGWAPHWTLLCVPADDTESTMGQSGSTAASLQTLGAAVTDMDLSAAQMQLCLRLDLPLLVVITKLDLASRTGLKGTLSKVLDALKLADRKPVIIPNTPGDVSEDDLQYVQASALDNAYNAALPLLNDSRKTVPIVLTSASQGTGINNLHALLHELPIPASDLSQHALPRQLFLIEDVYSKPSEAASNIVGGYVRSGQISVGDEMVLGPYSSPDQLEDSEDSDERPARRHSASMPTSRSFPGALRNSHLAPPHFTLPKEEWRHFTVVSIRNLRLPVHTLHQDQVGTLAIIPNGHHSPSSTPVAALSRIRKGMVMANIQPVATRTFVAEFVREDMRDLAVGNHVVAYIASVRASARVVSSRAPDSPLIMRKGSPVSTDGDEITGELDALKLDDVPSRLGSNIGSVARESHVHVTFSFDATKEFVAVGDQVLIMPGGGHNSHAVLERGQKGMPGLDGFVGIVREAHA